jgi:hypothetical protein
MTMTRSELTAMVEARAVGAQEAVRHTHIECNCPDLAHRRSDFDEGCFCPDCAIAAAVALGYPPTDTEPEKEGPDDGPQWCENCGRLITLRSTPDLPWGITAEGALAELEHYETGLGFKRGEPRTPDHWRNFLLVVDAIAEEHLPRVEAVIEKRAFPVARTRTKLDVSCRGPVAPPASWRDVVVAIPTTLPARERALARLVTRVAAECPGAHVLIYPHAAGDPVRVDFPRVIAAAARVGRPWILQLEDDVELCPGFGRSALEAGLDQADCLTLFTRSKEDLKALERGALLRKIGPSSFSMSQAFFLRAAVAGAGIEACADEWYGLHPEHNRGADLLLGYFLSKLGARVLVRIPSLVQHRLLPSTLPNHRGARQSDSYRRAFGELVEDDHGP